MHPLLASGSRLTLYLVSWSLVAVLLALGYSNTDSLGWTQTLIVLVPPWLIYSFVCLSAWYVCRSTPLQGASVSGVAIAHLGSGILAGGIWIMVWELWTQVLSDYPEYGEGLLEAYRSQLPMILAAGVLLFWLSGMLHYLLIAFETSRQAETRELGLEVMAREAELKALRAQIDPHFLFNSLHSVSALTTVNPSGARRMCLLLADFFRSSVRLGAKDQIPLEDEMEMVLQYLEIEKVRFGARLASEVAVDPECKNCMIPPLILQPLVENSVRHGIHSLVNGGVVKVTARCDPNYLLLSVENPVDPEPQKSAGTGMGLSNVKRRLETRLGDRTSTRIQQGNGLFRVEIRVPCIDPTEGSRK